MWFITNTLSCLIGSRVNQIDIPFRTKKTTTLGPRINYDTICDGLFPLMWILSTLHPRDPRILKLVYKINKEFIHTQRHELFSCPM